MFPKIAIIHPDTLAAIGLKHMLQEVMPMIDIDTFRSVKEIPAECADGYIHYFAATGAVVDDIQIMNLVYHTVLVVVEERVSDKGLGQGSRCTTWPGEPLLQVGPGYIYPGRH